MHATEMVADACSDGVRIARRNRTSAGVELSRRCYLVVAVVAPVSTAVDLTATAQRSALACGIHRARHQTRAWLTHRQTFLGMRHHPRILRFGGG